MARMGSGEREWNCGRWPREDSRLREVEAEWHTAAVKLYAMGSRDQLSSGVNRTVTYKVAIEQNEEGFSVNVPGLPGCWSQGATELEAIENIQAAIREYLAARDELLGSAEIREIEVKV